MRRRIESFLLRIVVPEEGCLTPDMWRGRVQHIGTGVEYAFADFEELLSLMTQHVQPLTTADYDLQEAASDLDAQ